jgi:hypothetical protein
MLLPRHASPRPPAPGSPAPFPRARLWHRLRGPHPSRCPPRAWRRLRPPQRTSQPPPQYQVQCTPRRLCCRRPPAFDVERGTAVGVPPWAAFSVPLDEAQTGSGVKESSPMGEAALQEEEPEDSSSIAKTKCRAMERQRSSSASFFVLSPVEPQESPPLPRLCIPSLLRPLRPLPRPAAPAPLIANVSAIVAWAWDRDGESNVGLVSQR